MLQTTTLSECTLVLLKRLQQLPVLKGFRLVGGTALALQLGHRKSVDLVFFGNVSLTRDDIVEAVEDAGLEIIPQKNTLRIHIFEINKVKVDIVTLPYEWIEPPVQKEGVKMAGLKDIAAMKLEAITNRGSKKDFIDVYFLLQHFSLQQMLDLYCAKYPKGAVFNVMRSLTYFEDAEDNKMPEMLANVQWEEIKSKIQKTIKDYGDTLP
ncbi:MAG: nucleotidyl transferase AbiEii/AbiGii toxin family protein [Bacteroidales bacterium]|nr:nucleotidyl transferase AbiEii/AbiGii toxin family protein [Bacteroidales bacterium]